MAHFLTFKLDFLEENASNDIFCEAQEVKSIKSLTMIVNQTFQTVSIKKSSKNFKKLIFSTVSTSNRNVK